ncbi:unnamed protein product [Clavelina lepadiformis]|uniref:Ig-like domain-containing protein n=1 Tax=Clavelina lepadiformis TaxID=159417 RepID=A0ABP0F4M6_CLALP
MTTVTGTESIGSSLTISKSLFVFFPKMFLDKPTLSASAEGSASFPDRFIVLINRVYDVGFDCTVKRNDQQTGWAQDPTLTWEATGIQVPEATGSVKVGSSTKNEKSLRVKFEKVILPRTPVIAWVKGDTEFPDRFSVSVNIEDPEEGEKFNGFECTVRRKDTDSGWSQDPTLYWNSVFLPFE